MFILGDGSSKFVSKQNILVIILKYFCLHFHKLSSKYSKVPESIFALEALCYLLYIMHDARNFITTSVYFEHFNNKTCGEYCLNSATDSYLIYE